MVNPLTQAPLLLTREIYNKNDDCLFDLELLNEICYGLHNTALIQFESHENASENNDKSSCASKKIPSHLRTTRDKDQHSMLTPRHDCLFKTDLDQMWSELNSTLQEPECNEEMTAKKPNKFRFPEQLRMILDEAQHSSALSWHHNGKSFIIHNQVAFENEILPLFFKTGRWKSFQKQLNIYGFERVEWQRRTYYHKYFIRKKPSLMNLMKREKVWPKSK